MKFGISTISIVPVRSEPNDRSEMTTQLLFGEHYKVLETQNKWSKIHIAHDKYVGCLSNNQIQEINQDEFIEKVVEKSKEVPVLVDFWAPCVLRNLYFCSKISLEKKKYKLHILMELMKIDLVTNNFSALNIYRENKNRKKHQQQ